VQRDREVDIQARLGEPVDARHDADGGHGHLPPAQRPRLGGADADDGGEHVVEVVHRLAHPHEDEGPEAPADLTGGAAQVEELLDDLPRPQVALQARAGAGAEVAAHRAADL
jgi:hypothetical protein